MYTRRTRLVCTSDFFCFQCFQPIYYSLSPLFRSLETYQTTNAEFSNPNELTTISLATLSGDTTLRECNVWHAYLIPIHDEWCGCEPKVKRVKGRQQTISASGG